MMAWTSSNIATVRSSGIVARLDKISFHASEVRGCESTHQVGLWTSEILRPKGQMRYGEVTRFAPITRLNYVPAGIPWMVHLDHQAELKPAFYCDFDSELFRGVSGIEPDDSPQFLSKCLAIESLALQRAIWLLLDEIQNPGFAHEVAVESYGRIVLVELGRYFKTIDESEERKAGALSSWQMQRLRAYVEEIEGQALTISGIAEYCGVSAAHLRRLFKATTGTTIGSYIEMTRMERARSLLVDKRLPLKEIAFRLGFASPASFSTAFRRAAGVTPMTYRQMTIA